MQHKYHTKIDDQIEKTSANMRSLLCGKLSSVMEKTLSKLATFDEGNMLGSMMGFVVSVILLSPLKTNFINHINVPSLWIPVLSCHPSISCPKH